MVKKKQTQSRMPLYLALLIIAILAIILSVLFLIPYITGGAGVQLPYFPDTPPSDEGQDLTYEVEINFFPNTICVGESVDIEVESNMPSANCIIYLYAGGIWNNIGTVTLASDGDADREQTVNTQGIYTLRLTCTAPDGTYKHSNEETLTVNDCDSDGDGWSNQEEIDAGTDPFDGGNYPGSSFTDCSTMCSDNGFTFGRGTVPTPDDCTGIEFVVTDNFGNICCCSNTEISLTCSDNDGGYPTNVQYSTADSCTDVDGTVHQDYCDADGKLKEFTCLGVDQEVCSEGLVSCWHILGDPNFCMFGSCVEYDGGIYEDECQGLGYDFGYSLDHAVAASGSCTDFSNQFCRGRNEIMLETTPGTNVAEGFNYCCWTCSV